MKRGAPRSIERLPVFSFLAVLVCFMGCLLALLMIIGQRAQATLTDLGADSAPDAPDAQSPDSKSAEQQEKLRGIQETMDKLASARAALSERLANDRARLAHVEDHTRRMRDQIQQQRQDAQELLRIAKGGEAEKATLRSEVNRVEKLVTDSTQMLEETRQQAARKTSYAVIPYEGTHATRRRPIYLECRSDAVIVQPEGVALREKDFDDELGADSPLATALRAASEHVARDPAAAGGQAYPLLIVRASGIRAYYAARAMLSSWSDDFGYELVDDNWDLKFPPPDPRLAEVLNSAVTVARRRKQFHADMLGSQGGGGSISGGVRGGGGGGGDATGNLANDGTSGGSPFPGARGHSRFGTGGTGGSPRLTGLSGPANGGNGPGAVEPGVPGMPQNGFAGGGGRGGMSGGTGGSGFAGGSGNGVGGGAGGGSGGDGGSVATGRGVFLPNAGGGQGNMPAGVAGAQGLATQGGSNGNQPIGGGSAGGGGMSFPGGVVDPGAGGTNAQRGAAAPAMPLGMASVAPAGMGDYRPPKKSDKPSLAETRGQNWALPGASQGAVGVTRPLRLDVAADRIVFDPVDGSGARQEIPCAGRTEDAIEKLVSTMWEQMRGWGIAGRGMYWKPVLNIHVTRGGQQRAQELKDLLAGSGLDVRIQP